MVHEIDNADGHAMIMNGAACWGLGCPTRLPPFTTAVAHARTGLLVDAQYYLHCACLVPARTRHSARLRSAMQPRKGGKKRRRRDDEEEQRPRKRGKEEADEDDDIFGYGATDPKAGEAWTEEQDLRVSCAIAFGQFRSAFSRSRSACFGLLLFAIFSSPRCARTCIGVG